MLIVTVQKELDVEKTEWSTSFISAALLGTALLVLVEGILNQGNLDTTLTIALYAFSASIPLLAHSILKPGYQQTVIRGNRWPSTSTSSVNRIGLILEVTGWIAAVIGLTATIWHLSSTAAYIFISTGVFAFFIRPFLELSKFLIAKLLHLITTITRIIKRTES